MSSHSLNLVRASIHAGMAYLDKFEPSWLDKINADGLDLRHSDSCVLGQVGGDFWAYLDDNNVGAVWAQERGFDILPNTPMGGIEDAYSQLTDEWKKAIEARKGKKAIEARKGKKPVGVRRPKDTNAVKLFVSQQDHERLYVGLEREVLTPAQARKIAKQLERMADYVESKSR